MMATSSEASERQTFGEKILRAREQLDQARVNLAQTRVAREDALANDGDVAPHDAAIGSLTARIELLESTIAGLQRRHIEERHGELAVAVETRLAERDQATAALAIAKSEIIDAEERLDRARTAHAVRQMDAEHAQYRYSDSARALSDWRARNGLFE